MSLAMTRPFSLTVGSAARRRRRNAKKTTLDNKQSHPTGGFGGRKKGELWRCVEGCGACCKLNKGPSFASPEEIFTDPSDVELYKSLIGPDGWCVHFEKSTRKCSIYADRPYFCRVEPDVFKCLYGIEKKKFNKDACSFCRDTIKAIYGSHSEELYNFNNSIRSSSNEDTITFGELHHEVKHGHVASISMVEIFYAAIADLHAKHH